VCALEDFSEDCSLLKVWRKLLLLPYTLEDSCYLGYAEYYRSAVMGKLQFTFPHIEAFWQSLSLSLLLSARLTCLANTQRAEKLIFFIFFIKYSLLTRTFLNGPNNPGRACHKFNMFFPRFRFSLDIIPAVKFVCEEDQESFREFFHILWRREREREREFPRMGKYIGGYSRDFSENGKIRIWKRFRESWDILWDVFILKNSLL